MEFTAGHVYPATLARSLRLLHSAASKRRFQDIQGSRVDQPHGTQEVTEGIHLTTRRTSNIENTLLASPWERIHRFKF